MLVSIKESPTFGNADKKLDFVDPSTWVSFRKSNGNFTMGGSNRRYLLNKNPYLHSVDKSPLKHEKAKAYTVAVICEDSWLDSCDVVVPIWPLSSHKGLPHEENQIEIQEEDPLVRYA